MFEVDDRVVIKECGKEDIITSVKCVQFGGVQVRHDFRVFNNDTGKEWTITASTAFIKIRPYHKGKTVLRAI